MKTYIDAKSLIDELSAACMPIYEKGITGILGDATPYCPCCGARMDSESNIKQETE